MGRNATPGQLDTRDLVFDFALAMGILLLLVLKVHVLLYFMKKCEGTRRCPDEEAGAYAEDERLPLAKEGADGKC